MYARLRGVRPASIAATVGELLARLQLEQYADRCVRLLKQSRKSSSTPCTVHA